jgi:Ca2+-binding RTX toxin-like protein
LPANYTFTSGDSGVHNFSATLKTAGSQSITVQDLTNPNVAPGTQSAILVLPAATSQLVVSGFPPGVTAGVSYNFTVTAFDPYGNVVTGYRGTVTFSSTDSQALLPANYLFTSADAGVHTFAVTLNTLGTQSVSATDTANASITGSESMIVVFPIQPMASVSGPTLGVPGQPLGYTLSASESGLPAGTTYSYSVQWGDGSPVQSFSGSSGTQASHAYTSPGAYTITVTATDPKGNISVPVSTSVTLTTVAMEIDPYNSSLTALYVGGTLGNDTIAITPVAGGGVKVGMNFVNYGSFFPTGHVVVYSQSGNDIIKTAAQTINGVLTYVNMPVLFFAGNGNDILNVTGSSANNVLVGGGGTDRLLGGQGRDILIGGAGQATLNAGAGGDILIGGTTAYDNNAAALASILAEWSRTDIDYATCIAHLTGSMSGGLNGSYFLNASTVHDNGLADNLYGGPGMDWFFAGIMDVIYNKTSGEVVTQI